MNKNLAGNRTEQYLEAEDRAAHLSHRSDQYNAALTGADTVGHVH